MVTMLTIVAAGIPRCGLLRDTGAAFFGFGTFDGLLASS
jgi:hypothetical protein